MTIHEHSEPARYIAFITHDARFTAGLGPFTDDSTKVVRVVIVELGHAECESDTFFHCASAVALSLIGLGGLIASQIDDSEAELMVLIDQMFWFEADEVCPLCSLRILSLVQKAKPFTFQILGKVQIVRLSAVPHGTWMNYEFIFPSRLDFSDFVRTLSEAKSHILYHRFRMVESLTAVFEQQFRSATMIQAGRAAGEVAASGSCGAPKAAEDGDAASAPLPQQPGFAVANVASAPVSPQDA